MSANALLPHPRIHNAEYKIQSCIVVSNNVYCSLWQHGVGAHIYEFSLKLVQPYQRGNISIQPTNIWHIRDNDTLQSCFLSVYQEHIIFICYHVIEDKSVIEVKKPKLNSNETLPAEYRFELPYVVKVVALAAIPRFESLVLAVIYDLNINDTNKRYIKRVDMSSHKCAVN